MERPAPVRTVVGPARRNEVSAEMTAGRVVSVGGVGPDGGGNAEG